MSTEPECPNKGPRHVLVECEWCLTYEGFSRAERDEARAEVERLRDALRQIVEAGDHVSLTVRSTPYMAEVARRALDA